jgi:hypothetical protein
LVTHEFPVLTNRAVIIGGRTHIGLLIRRIGPHKTARVLLRVKLASGHSKLSVAEPRSAHTGSKALSHCRVRRPGGS